MTNDEIIEAMAQIMARDDDPAVIEMYRAFARDALAVARPAILEEAAADGKKCCCRDAARAQADELAKALRPFANLARLGDKRFPEAHDNDEIGVAIGYLRDASAAFAKYEAPLEERGE